MKVKNILLGSRIVRKISEKLSEKCQKKLSEKLSEKMSKKLSERLSEKCQKQCQKKYQKNSSFAIDKNKDRVFIISDFNDETFHFILRDLFFASNLNE